MSSTRKGSEFRHPMVFPGSFTQTPERPREVSTTLARRPTLEINQSPEPAPVWPSTEIVVISQISFSRRQITRIVLKVIISRRSLSFYSPNPRFMSRIDQKCQLISKLRVIERGSSSTRTSTRSFSSAARRSPNDPWSRKTRDILEEKNLREKREAARERWFMIDRETFSRDCRSIFKQRR